MPVTSLLFLLFLFLLPSLLQSLPRSARRRFSNIAPKASSGHLSNYRRTPSYTRALWVKRLQSSLQTSIPRFQTPTFPFMTGGQPGVAIGDFNGDGFDDIYVTNGPGTYNSLFINEYPKRRILYFRDVGKQSGLGAKEQDSTGVCYGDLNRDGIPDFVVVSEYSANKVFLSTGTKGKWKELDWVAATGDKNKYSSAGCALGDVNGDGWLDILIANTIPRSDTLACLVVPYERNNPNQLFLNERFGNGGLKFKDVSMKSGINDIGGDVPKGKFTVTWGAALVDVNLDGNLDIVVADDQCGVSALSVDSMNGANRGGMRIQYGNGQGEFKTKTLIPREARKNGRIVGDENWMGVGVGDFNCDGRLDLFGSNSGDYHKARYDSFMGRGINGELGLLSSRWWVQEKDGGFRDASLEETGATVFGWGNAVCDYDNDGDQDIFMVGGLDFSAFAGSDNPNIIYKNHNCGANFTYDLESLEPTGTTRSYQGFAIGDFNQDGYPDVVGAAGIRVKPDWQDYIVNYSSPLDKTAHFTNILKPSKDVQGWTWTGRVAEEGDLMVQINRRGKKNNCWVSVMPAGMVGVLDDAKVNRGGLGATLRVWGEGMRPVLSPVVSGDSFGSQHSGRRNFGLGRKCKGFVEVIWPGGLVNRVKVKAGEVLTVPEIPCRVEGKWEKETAFRQCVLKNVLKLVVEGVVDVKFGIRLTREAVIQRFEYLQRMR